MTILANNDIKSMLSQEAQWLLREKYNGEKNEGFFADCERLRDGEPLAYILGHIPFLSTTIFLDSQPLIPRVETEYWTGEIIKQIQKSHISRPRILDVCAGSGCIGVAIAHAHKEATVHFAEIDVTHHATIAKNIRENNIEESRTRIFGGHLFEEITDLYDYIVCNPPYIKDGSAHVQESVKKFEPGLALYGGEDGMELIAQIIEQAPAHLLPHGVLVLEHEPDQEAALHTQAVAAGFSAHTHIDQYGVSRYTIFRMAQ